MKINVTSPSSLAGRFVLCGVLALFMLAARVCSAETGATEGVVSVSNMGVASYSIPIQVAPGVLGQSPTLAIQYSSSGGNGMMGSGWSLSGLSQISRSPQTIEHDGSYRGVRLGASDRLALDGMRLMNITGSGLSGEFRTEVDSFSKIVSSGVGYVVHTKDEYTKIYEGVSAHGLSGVQYYWTISSVEDKAGNVIDYEYYSGGVYGKSIALIKSISYADCLIKFEYEDRSDNAVSRIAGAEVQLNKRLKRIAVLQPGSLTEEWYSYDFDYNYSNVTGESLLVAIDDSRIDGAIAILWPEVGNAFPHQPSESPGSVPGGWSYVSSHNLPSGVHVSQLPSNGEDYQSVVFKRTGSASSPAKPVSWDDPTGWSDVPPGAGEGDYLWVSYATKEYDGSLVGSWSDPIRGDERNEVEILWSANGSDNWHVGYASGDKYLKKRIGFSAWSSPELAVGETDTYTSYIFRRSSGVPSISKFSNNPTSWLDSPSEATGSGHLWVSYAVKDDGSLVGEWSDPFRADHVVHDVYWSDESFNTWEVDGGWHHSYVSGDRYVMTTQEGTYVEDVDELDDPDFFDDPIQFAANWNLMDREVMYFASNSTFPPSQNPDQTYSWNDDPPFSDGWMIKGQQWLVSGNTVWGAASRYYNGEFDSPDVRYQWARFGLPDNDWHYGDQADDRYLRVWRKDALQGYNWVVDEVLKAIEEDTDDWKVIVFKRVEAEPSKPSGSSHSGWSKSPPAGTGALWCSTATFDLGGSIWGGWSDPLRIDNQRPQFLWAVNEGGPWHTEPGVLDKFAKTKAGNGAWGEPFRVADEEGFYNSYVFRLSYSRPTTPVGDGVPTFWSDAPTLGSSLPLWMSSAQFDEDGDLVGPWSTPVRADYTSGIGDFVALAWSDSISGPWGGYEPGDTFIRVQYSNGSWSSGMEVKTEFQWSANGSTEWHDEYVSGDAFFRSRVGPNPWSVAQQILHEEYGESYFDGGVNFVDLNADGLTDFLHTDGGGIEAYLKTEQGTWTRSAAFDLSRQFFYSRARNSRFGRSVSAFYRGSEFRDLNGDGRVDFLHGRGSTLEAYINTGSTWVASLGYKPKHPLVGTSADGEFHYEDGAVRLVDLNGDSLLDYVYWRSSGGGSPEVYLNTGSGWSGTNSSAYHPKHPLTIESSGVYYDNGLRFEDVNGDGLVDQLFGNGTNLKAYLNNGSGFDSSSSSAFAPLHPFVREVAGFPGVDAGSRLIDLNGDGLVDQIVAWQSGSASLKQVLINTGTGWDAGIGGAYEPPEYFVVNGRDNGVRLFDVSGDGLVDFLYGNGGVRSAYINTGSGFTTTSSVDHAPKDDIVSGLGGDNGTRFVHLDADGIVDFLVSRDRNGTVNDESKSYVNTSGGPSLVQRVTTELGYKVSFEYNPLTDSDYYSKSSGSVSFPIVNYIGPMYVATKVSKDNGKGGQYITDYTYANARMHLHGRGFLGFEIYESYDRATQMSTVENLSQAFPWIGMVESSEVRDSGDVLISAVTNNFGAKSLNNGKTSFPYIHTSDRADYSGLSHTLTTNTYDSHGNIDLSVIAYDDGSTVSGDHDYNPDVAEWELSRLTKKTVTHSTPNSPTLVTHEDYEYYDNGLLKKSYSEKGTALEVAVEYERLASNKWNISKRTTTGYDIATRSELFEDFATNGFKYAKYSRNALTHRTEYEYDDRFGLPKKAIDPNGNEATTTYSDLGRSGVSTSPDGTITSVTVSPVSLYGAVYKMSVQVEGSPPNVEYYDVLGRKVRSETIGGSGQSIVQRFEYYDHGLLFRSSTAHEASATPQWITATYDSFMRLKTEVLPTNATTTYDYSGTMSNRVTTVTSSFDDAPNQVTSTTVDARGLVVAVVDALGSALEFEHDAMGRVVSSTADADNTAIVTTYAYDLRGNKTSMNDPDSGFWEYSYDALGQLKTQTDAELNITVVDYDVLGRMTQRAVGGQTSYWRYDNAGPRGKLGLLHYEEGPNGYLRMLYYDNKSRPEFEVKRIDDRYFYTQTVYGIHSRVEKRINHWRPMPLVAPEYNNHALWNSYGAVYEYDQRGFVSEVGDTEGRVWWDSPVYDEEGRVTDYSYGNGIVTAHRYDATSKFIDSTSSSVQDLEYDFYDTGNLKSLADGRSGKSYAYGYDALNRLRTVSGSASYAIEIDRIGNITSKGGMSYSYSGIGAGPHAVTTANGINYAYDDNGNVLSRGSSSSVQWTAFNKPSVLATGGATSQFSYDSEFQRISQLVTKDGQSHRILYISSGFEQEVSSGQTETRVYMSGPSGRVGMRAFIESATPIAVAGEAVAFTKEVVSYFHSDNLGSIAQVTDENGQVVEEYGFDAWGQRSEVKQLARSFGLNRQQVRRGYTGHETLEEHNLVHMNGRIYDPSIARMLSPDPFVQSPLNLQNYNRYSYVLNNPLLLTDPTGYFWSHNTGPRISFIAQIYSAFAGYVMQKRLQEAVQNQVKATVEILNPAETIPSGGKKSEAGKTDETSEITVAPAAPTEEKGSPQVEPAAEGQVVEAPAQGAEHIGGTDYDTVLNINAFIPGSLSSDASHGRTWLPEPGPGGWFLDNKFGTDGREFGQFDQELRNARLMITISFNSKDIGSLSSENVSVDVFDGPSFQMSKSGEVYSRTAMPQYTKRIQNSDLVVASAVTVNAGASYPFSRAAPNIDIMVTFIAMTTNDRGLNVRMFAGHDNFPAYEAYYNGTLIYTSPPIGEGPGLRNLNSSRNGRAEVNVP